MSGNRNTRIRRLRHCTPLAEQSQRRRGSPSSVSHKNHSTLNTCRQARHTATKLLAAQLRPHSARCSLYRALAIGACAHSHSFARSSLLKLLTNKLHPARIRNSMRRFLPPATPPATPPAPTSVHPLQAPRPAVLVFLAIGILAMLGSGSAIDRKTRPPCTRACALHSTCSSRTSATSRALVLATCTLLLCNSLCVSRGAVPFEAALWRVPLQRETKAKQSAASFALLIFFLISIVFFVSF